MSTVVAPLRTRDLLLRRLRRRPVVAGALAVLAAFVVLAVAAPAVAPYDPYTLIPGGTLRPPSLENPFGTDELGRDIASRVIFGSRISLQVGFITVGIALVAGTLVGLLAGYYGGRLDSALMAVMEVLLAFPQILLALAILAMLGPSLYNAMIAVGISGIPVYARTARGVTLGLKGMDYLEAARALGAADRRVVLRHVLPNMIPPIIVLATAGMGISLLVAAGLSYLGLGAQPPLPEWGAMLSEARGYLRNAWWMATFPGLAIMVLVLSFNICGDWLRDVLDPRLRT
ncbi:MAG: ABC transporter permease [Armatimonadota bacterium]|nr:ABC transporter permease [Armatimonadota bacterium]